MRDNPTDDSHEVGIVGLERSLWSHMLNDIIKEGVDLPLL